MDSKPSLSRASPSHQQQQEYDDMDYADLDTASPYLANYLFAQPPTPTQKPYHQQQPPLYSPSQSASFDFAAQQRNKQQSMLRSSQLMENNNNNSTTTSYQFGAIQQQMDALSRHDVLVTQMERHRNQMFQRMHDSVEKAGNELKLGKSKLDELIARVNQAEKSMEEKRSKLMQEVVETKNTVASASKKKNYSFEKSLLDDNASVVTTGADFEHDFLAGLSP